MAKGFKRPSFPAGSGMIQQIQRLQQQLEQAQEQLAKEEFTASVGGGAVQVTLNGEMQCTKVQIDPQFLQDTDAEMLQDLLLSAFNLAIEQRRKRSEELFSPLSSGLDGLLF